MVTSVGSSLQVRPLFRVAHESLKGIRIPFSPTILTKTARNIAGNVTPFNPERVQTPFHALSSLGKKGIFPYGPDIV
jgi:hypothetical protein